MKTPDSTLAPAPDDAEQRLLELLARQRDAECLALQQRARQEAADLLRKARHRATKLVRRTVAAERARIRARMAEARAELNTRRRRHARQLGSVVLDMARRRLPERLAEMWADPTGRASWIEQAVRHARQGLPDGRWRIRHAFCFNATDNDTLLRALGDNNDEAPHLEADPAMEAGLVIECAGVTLDASVSGLLADPDQVEARLLALIDLEAAP